MQTWFEPREHYVPWLTSLKESKKSSIQEEDCQERVQFVDVRHQSRQETRDGHANRGCDQVAQFIEGEPHCWFLKKNSDLGPEFKIYISNFTHWRRNQEHSLLLSQAEQSPLHSSLSGLESVGQVELDQRLLNLIQGQWKRWREHMSRGIDEDTFGFDWQILPFWLSNCATMFLSCITCLLRMNRYLHWLNLRRNDSLFYFLFTLSFGTHVRWDHH